MTKNVEEVAAEATAKVANAKVKVAEATEVIEESKAKVAELTEALVEVEKVVGKVFFVYDRDHVVEAEVLGEGSNGNDTLNLRVVVDGTSSDFGNVRKGFGGGDIGAYFTE